MGSNEVLEAPPDPDDPELDNDPDIWSGVKDGLSEGMVYIYSVCSCLPLMSNINMSFCGTVNCD